MPNGILDAEGTVFFKRQLEAIKTETYDQEYADLSYRNVFPATSSTPPGATSIVWRSWDRVGMAKVINAYAKDLPRVDKHAKEFSSPIRTVADSFGYSVDEIESAQLIGMNLPGDKAEVARRAVEELQNQIAFFGDDESGLPGLLNNANIPRGDVPDGAGGFPEWSTKTGKEIAADINDACNDMFALTKQKERPNTLLVPTAQWALINSTDYKDESEKTIAQYIVQNNTFINSIDSIIPVNELAGAGTAGVDIFVVYNRDPRKLEMEIPLEFLIMDEQIVGLEYTVPCRGRFGGLIVRYPLSISIREKI